jgi:AraC family transcriptional activator of pobA
MLIDIQRGESAFEIFSFADPTRFKTLQRNNHYSLMLLQEGSIELMVDFQNYTIQEQTMICLSPYQPYKINALQGVKGVLLNFHSDFFCTYRHQNEIATEGALFHTIYQPPFFNITEMEALTTLLHQMKTEMEKEQLGQHELLVSYLKIFLITALRIKSRQEPAVSAVLNSKVQIIQKLIEHIETHYRTKHSASDYADLLHISAKVLSAIVKKHFNKTLSDLIAQRIITEAKRELYLTSKKIKEVAHLLGYPNEYYFSRFFKKQTSISPQIYRDTVGFAKAETL